MNDELQKQIAEILKQALDAAQKGGHWMAGQIPDVLHQLIVWTIAQGVISVLAFFAVFTIGYLATTKWASQKLDYADMWSGPKIGSCIGWVIGSLVFFLVAVTQGYNALEAIFAPKLFLLEYAAHMIHSP